jgi:hypothetical protein
VATRPDAARTLTAGLVTTLLAACAVLGIATALFLRAFLLSQLAGQLAAAGGRFSASLEHGGSGPGGSDGDGDNAVLGQSVGTLGVRLATGRVAEAAIVAEDGTNRTITFPGRRYAAFGPSHPGGRPSSDLGHRPARVGVAGTDADTASPTSIGPAEPTSEGRPGQRCVRPHARPCRAALAAPDATEGRLRRFVADASHELRTPLATIRAHAEYAARGDALPRPDPSPIPDRITAATDRMGALVADLLLLARLDAGRPLARDPVDLTRLVLDAVSDDRTAGPTHRWRLDLPEEVVVVTGDADRLHQVLANLLGNARTHAPADITVTTALTVTPAAVEEAVRDRPGIPPALREDLFDRFTRGDASLTRAYGGTGLGMAIARSIAAAHSGSITVTSAPGEGATSRPRLLRYGMPW